MWPPKEVERIVEPLDKALRSLKDKVGKGQITTVKLHRKEIVAYCKLERFNEEITLKVKYRGGEVWVEGPRSVAMPLKNRVSRLLGIDANTHERRK